MTSASRCAFVLLALSLSGCRNNALDAPDVAAELTLEAPARTGRVPVCVCLRDQKGSAVTGAQLILEGNMMHPGMRPEIVPLSAFRAGCYGGDLTFTMPGDWYVRISGTLADGRPLERSFPVPHVRASGG